MIHMTDNWQWQQQQYNKSNDNILIIIHVKCFQAEMHAGILRNIVQCKIVCSDDLIWTVGRTFGYVVNKYLSNTWESNVNKITFASDMLRVFLFSSHKIN